MVAKQTGLATVVHSERRHALDRPQGLAPVRYRVARIAPSIGLAQRQPGARSSPLSYTVPFLVKAAGKTIDPELLALIRFCEKVRINLQTGCWLWTGAPGKDGYGAFKFGNKQIGAHRWIMKYLKGPLTSKQHIDHLCRVKHCVNFDHLEVVTGRINTLRGIGPTAINARKSKCLRGHPLRGKNLYNDASGGRVCKACNKIRVLKHKARKEAGLVWSKPKAGSK